MFQYPFGFVGAFVAKGIERIFSSKAEAGRTVNYAMSLYTVGLVVDVIGVLALFGSKKLIAFTSSEVTA